jgi:hypothetical protein
MRSRLGFTTLLFVVITLAGCASSMDEQVAEDPGDGELAEADSAVAGTSTFFEIKSDLRKCAAPMCGGWWIERLNRSSTTCHDGQRAHYCYTPVLDWSESNLPEAQRATMLDACNRGALAEGTLAIVRGRFARTNSTTPFPAMGRFVITEAWVAENDAVSDGTFVWLADNGVRCVTSPCPSYTEKTLNFPAITDIAAVDFSPARLTDDQLGECLQRMATPQGLLVAGYRYTVYGDAGSANARNATAAYYRLSDESY